MLMFYVLSNSLSSKEPEVDRHPERRLKAAYAAFESAHLPRLKAENPTLRLSQLKEMLRKEWNKSPENPLVQAAMAARSWHPHTSHLSLSSMGSPSRWVEDIIGHNIWLLMVILWDAFIVALNYFDEIQCAKHVLYWTVLLPPAHLPEWVGSLVYAQPAICN